MTTLDGTAFAFDAEIIHAATRGGIPLPMADDYELWELAAALGVHRIETRADYNAREVVAKKAAEWEESGEARLKHLAGYSERRRARKLERRKASGGRTN